MAVRGPGNVGDRSLSEIDRGDGVVETGTEAEHFQRQRLRCQAEVFSIDLSARADRFIVDRGLQGTQVGDIEPLPRGEGCPVRPQFLAFGRLPLLCGNAGLANRIVAGGIGPHGEDRDASNGAEQRRHDDPGRGGRQPVPSGEADERIDQPRRAGGDRFAAEIPPQIGLQFACARVPLVTILLQTLGNHRSEIAPQPRIHRGERFRLDILHDPGHLVDRTLRDVIRQHAGEQFVEHHTECIDIGSNIEIVRRPIELLGCHVRECAHELADVGMHRGQRSVAGSAPRHTEINDLRLACRIDEDVARFQIPMDDTLLMAMSDCPAGFTEEQNPLARREPPMM